MYKGQQIIDGINDYRREYKFREFDLELLEV